MRRDLDIAGFRLETAVDAARSQLVRIRPGEVTMTDLPGVDRIERGDATEYDSATMADAYTKWRIDPGHWNDHIELFQCKTCACLVMKDFNALVRHMDWHRTPSG
jgi:hypothetical protein